jgi:hypothetical protein
MTRSDLIKQIVAALRRHFPAASYEATQKVAEELGDLVEAAGYVGEARRVKIVYDPKADLAWSARDAESDELMLWAPDRMTLLNDCRERGWTVIDQESPWKSE